MGTLTIEDIDTDTVSDGYHTFGDLYQHRIALFVALMKSHPKLSWYSEYHSDGSSFLGWFIAGMDLPTGMITYHLPNSMLKSMEVIQKLDKAPEWDGHTSNQVLARIGLWSDRYLTK